MKLEAECAKHERNLKVLENKLKAHEDNIQAMKSDLTHREDELQVTSAVLHLFNRLHLVLSFTSEAFQALEVSKLDGIVIQTSHVTTGICGQSHGDQPGAAAGDRHHQEHRRGNHSAEEDDQGVREQPRGAPAGGQVKNDRLF